MGWMSDVWRGHKICSKYSTVTRPWAGPISSAIIIDMVQVLSTLVAMSR